MIYTVTLNPALGYHIKIDRLMIDHLNIMNESYLCAAGKGINVSRMLNNLGIDNIALGIVGGVNGKMIIDDLCDAGIQNDLIVCDKINTRINIKIKTNRETEINHPGAMIDQAIFDLFLEKIDKINDGDQLVLSGSLPPSYANLYVLIIEKIKHKDVRLYIDTRKDNMIDCLRYRPFLIKPNLAELEELCSCKFTSLEQMMACAKDIQAKGAQNILLSLNKEGAILFTGDGKIFKASAPTGQLINSVGSGDAMLAGFIASCTSDGDLENALRYAIASGSASAFSKGLASKDELEALIGQIDIKKIK